jgi:hypothetical protein
MLREPIPTPAYSTTYARTSRWFAGYLVIDLILAQFTVLPLSFVLIPAKKIYDKDAGHDSCQ